MLLEQVRKWESQEVQEKAKKEQSCRSCRIRRKGRMSRRCRSRKVISNRKRKIRRSRWQE